MAATTSPHRCVLESRRLRYHRSCREQSDLMPTVNITFCVGARPPAAERRRAGLQARPAAALPEAGAECEAQRRAGLVCSAARNTQSTAESSMKLPQLRPVKGVQARWRGAFPPSLFTASACWRAGVNVFFFPGFHQCGDTALDQRLVFLQLVPCRRALILSHGVLSQGPGTWSLVQSPLGP